MTKKEILDRLVSIGSNLTGMNLSTGVNSSWFPEIDSFQGRYRACNALRILIENIKDDVEKHDG